MKFFNHFQRHKTRRQISNFVCNFLLGFLTANKAGVIFNKSVYILFPLTITTLRPQLEDYLDLMFYSIKYQEQK